MVEVEGKIARQSISVLIDPGSTHSYVTSKVVESCCLRKIKHNNSWLVQLATDTKWRESEVVMEYPIDLNGLLIKVNLNVLPLGSCDALISMAWLEKYRAKVDCYKKALEWIDEEERSRLVKGIPKEFLVRQVSTS